MVHLPTQRRTRRSTNTGTGTAVPDWVDAIGLGSLLIASTNAQVLDLNLRAQAARLATAAVPAERRVALADGTTVSDGDVIITRRNDRRLALTATDFVANGDRWTVTSVRPNGGLDVRHSRSHRRVTLPTGYVAEHVQLGYATTVHGAQGQTGDTGHTVLTGTEIRQLLYVALTRGRHENHLYLDVTAPGEDASRPPRPAVRNATPSRCCARRAPSISTRSCTGSRSTATSRDRCCGTKRCSSATTTPAS